MDLNTTHLLKLGSGRIKDACGGSGAAPKGCFQNIGTFCMCISLSYVLNDMKQTDMQRCKEAAYGICSRLLLLDARRTQSDHGHDGHDARTRATWKLAHVLRERSLFWKPTFASCTAYVI